MSRLSRIRRAPRGEEELNITAFLNLMVILVPFLLISAVFANMSILELNLPPAQDKSKAKQDKPKKVRNFELIIRKDKIIVADTLDGTLKTFKKKNGEYDLKGVQDILIEIKRRYPKKQNITILLEPNIPYDTLVQAMDTARLVAVVEFASVVKKELFPIISIGDAPPASGS